VKRMTAPSDKSPKNAKEKQKIYTAIRCCSLHMVEDGILPSIFPTKLRKGPSFGQRNFQYTIHAFVSGWRVSFIHWELERSSETTGYSRHSECFLTTANQNPILIFQKGFWSSRPLPHRTHRKNENCDTRPATIKSRKYARTTK
jgi:hypothetical protein